MSESIISDSELEGLNELFEKGADMTGHIEPYVKKILAKYEKIKKAMGHDYKKAMSEIASQERKTEQLTLGYIPSNFSAAFGSMPGGLCFNVLNNVLANFGLFIRSIPATGKDWDSPYKDLMILIFKKAMQTDYQLKMFIEKIISGADKNGNFDDPREMKLKKALGF